VLHFARTVWFSVQTGPFVIMLSEMVASDMLKFMSLVFVFQMGFAQANFILLDMVGSRQFVAQVRSAFEAMLGNFHFLGENTHANAGVANMLLLVYVVIAGVLLINLFIAMMSSTYESVMREAEHRWQLERARIMDSIEGEMTLSQRLCSANKFWAEYNGSAYLQVMRVDDEYFSLDAAEGRAEKAAAAAGQTLLPPAQRLANAAMSPRAQTSVDAARNTPQKGRGAQHKRARSTSRRPPNTPAAHSADRETSPPITRRRSKSRRR